MDGGIAVLGQVAFWGLYSGCIYILLATGLNLIFGVMKVVNFAHGEFLMLGTYVTFILFVASGFNPYILLFFSVPILIVVGVIVERLCFRPILGTGKLNEIFISLGLIYIFQNAVAMIWTDEWRSLKSPFADMTIALGPIQLPLDYIIIIAVTAVILLGLNAFLQRTTTGKAIRASSQNREGAMLTGINVERMDMLTFGIGAGLAGAAGTLWAVSGQVFNPYMGSVPAIKGFVIIILGGLGSIPGAIVGGLAIGMVENFTAFFLGGSWKDAISFILLILVLLIRPTGLFGEADE
jgi:branched-chain amino acid transport system permease protein